MTDSALHLYTRSTASMAGEAPSGSLLPGEWAGLSDAGRSRTHNEDAWRIDPGIGLIVLADGMGGYNAGEVASAIAVEAVALALADEIFGDDTSQPHDQLARAVHAANAAILAAVARRPECLGMGTTLAVAWICGSALRFSHVGDSRVYLLRAGRLYQLTRDHSVGQAMIDAGLSDPEHARRSSMRGVLTRALGVEPTVQPDYGEFELVGGDRLLLCSDGLTDMVVDDQIARILSRDASPPELAQDLVDRALAQGGFDNVTALVLKVPAHPVSRK